MGESDNDFNTLLFEKKLSQLKDTQESIQGLSSWCLKQRSHHKKIVSSWLNVLKRVKVEQRLTLFYLANDVIQYSKRKNYDFVASWGCYLQKATPLVRDEKVRKKIVRIFKIWEQRSVYDEEFLSDLTGLLSAGAMKKTADDDALDFQPQQLVNKIRQCTSLESDTDLCLKVIHDSHLELSDADALCASLKDKRDTDEVEKELNEGAGCVEKYTQALQKEIVAREALIMLLKSANQYYSTQRGEVKVVALAYKTFGQRVKQLKKKLDELIPTLSNKAPSPPLRDEDVPSPGPDEDFDLPGLDSEDVSYNIDKTFNTSLTADGSLYNVGISSFLGTDMLNVFNDSVGNQNVIDTGNKIEVINNRPKEVPPINVNNLIKTLIANDIIDSDSVPVTNISGNQSQDTLPGLDLLTPDSSGSISRPAPFYGAIDSNTNGEPEPYNPEMTLPWTPTNQIPQWSAPPVTNMAPSFPRLDTAPHATNMSTTFSRIDSAPLVTNMANTFPRMDTAPPATIAAPSFPPLDSAPPITNMAPIFPRLDTPDSHVSRGALDTPESPPPALAALRPPLMVPHTTMYSPDLPMRDIDHRPTTLPPPPPPPPILPPTLSHLEDIDQRLLQSLPPVLKPSLPNRLSAPKDVDHRNLISLTHQPSPTPVSMPRGPDQDYRVPPTLGPNDIVESVDMDLSEDEELQHHYQNQSNLSQNFNKAIERVVENRRVSSFQNNKVLVGGDTPRTEQPKLIQPVPILNSENNKIEPIKPPPMMPEALTAPPLKPLSNPFDNAIKKFENSKRIFRSKSPEFQGNKPNTSFRSDSPEFQHNQSNRFRPDSPEFQHNQSSRFKSDSPEYQRQSFRSNSPDFSQQQNYQQNRLNNPEFSPSRNQFSNYAPENDNFESIEDAVRLLDSPNNDIDNNDDDQYTDNRELVRNPSPPMSEREFSNQSQQQMGFQPRFQRPWNPMMGMRNNFRMMPYMSPQQFWPRPRMMNRPWMNRPRFW